MTHPGKKALERAISYTIDWDGSNVVGEPTRNELSCGDVLDILAYVEELERENAAWHKAFEKHDKPETIRNLKST